MHALSRARGVGVRRPCELAVKALVHHPALCPAHGGRGERARKGVGVVRVKVTPHPRAGLLGGPDRLCVPLAQVKAHQNAVLPKRSRGKGGVSGVPI